MKSSLLVILLFFVPFAFSQDAGTPISWAQSGNFDFSDMDADSMGNVFLAMQYSREFSIPELKRTIIDHNEVCGGVIKYDPKGKPLWLVEIKGISTVFQKSIYATKNGDFLITGIFYGEANFHSVSKLPKKVGRLKNKNEYHQPTFLFLARYSGKGNLIWVKVLNGLGEAISVVENNQGNLFWDVRFTKELTAGKKTIDRSEDTRTDWYKQIILKLNSEGEVTGKHPFERMIHTGVGGARTTHAKLLIDKEDALIINGDFQKSICFTERDSLTNDGYYEAYDAFIVKFDKNDNYVWSQKIGGQSHQIIRSLRLDEKGRIYMVGYYRNECIISNSIQLIQKSQFIEKPEDCLFYCCFSTEGQLEFSYFRRKPGDSGRGSINASAFVIDESGYTHVFGSYSDTLKWSGKAIVSERHGSNHSVFYGRWKGDSLVSISEPVESQKDWVDWIVCNSAVIKNNRIYVAGAYVGINYIKNKGNNIEISGERYRRSTFLYSFEIPDSEDSMEEPPTDHLAEIEPIIACLSPAAIAQSDIWIPMDRSETSNSVTLYPQEGCGVIREESTAVLFPNPTSDKTTLSVKGLKGYAVIQVFSASGQFLFSQDVQIEQNEQSFELNFAHVPPATYYIQLQQGDFRKILPLVKML